MPLDSAGRDSDRHDREVRLATMRLDAAATARLRGLRAKLEVALPALADRFYSFFAAQPAIAGVLRGPEHIARLRTTQIAHWQHLFEGSFDGAYFERATAIGAAHARIGLAPRWYVAGYCLTLEALTEHLVKQHRAPAALAADIGVVLRAALLDMDVALSTYTEHGDSDRMQQELLAMSDVLERELQTAVGEIALQTDRLTEGADQLKSIAAEMRVMTGQVHSAIEATSTTVSTVASASQEMEATSRDITARIDRAAAVSTQTVGQAASAGETMVTLSRSVEQINGVVRLVNSIAQRTKLLALNATIEAARAGEAGRGFAVVASEVKNLAQQTEQAIGTVSAQARDIQLATDGASDGVAGIATHIRGVADIAAGIAEAAGQQRQATAEIAESVALAAANAGTVADRARDLAERAAATEDTAALFHALAGRVSTGVGGLVTRLTLILRNSSAGSRRRAPREPMCLKFTLKAGGFQASGHTGDLSTAGVLLLHGAPESVAGTEGELELESIGRLAVRIVAASPMGMHICFTDPGPAVREAITARIAQEHAACAPYIDMAQRTAAAIEAAFEGALKSGRASKADLFDTIYRPVPGSDPQQMLTRATPICDAVLPAIIDPLRASDAAIAFCAPCDRDGYIATHNAIYSQPQRPGQRDWNIANSRNRRIFDDRTGLLAARTTEAILVQAYPRDMGGGVKVVLKEFDAPISVAGSRWGALRLAVKMQGAVG